MTTGPETWTLSVAAVLRTTAIAFLVYVTYNVVRFVYYIRWTNNEFGDAPGPKERHWFFGSGYYFPKDEAERVQYFIDLANKHGGKGYFRLWATTKARIHLCAPETMKRLLKTAEPKPTSFMGGYRFLKPWLGDGLLIAGGAKWARNRRLLTPAFHFDILKPYVEVYNRSADALIANLNRYAEQEKHFEVFQEISKCTLDIILKCAFSYAKDVQKLGESDPYITATNAIAAASAQRFRRPYLYPDIIWNLSSIGRTFNKNCDYVHSVAEDIIAKRRQTLESGQEVLQNRKYLDFLDILLTAKDENGVGLSPLEIRNEVDTFLFEGHDTTASAVSWILYSLAEHSEYQKKCQDEIDELFKNKTSNDVDWNDLSELEFLTMCIKEGMRLHCPVPIVSREIQHDLDIGPRVLPKGTGVGINILTLHHNEKVWDRHMEFIPERFSKENSQKMDPFQFVPFSGGPRNCIGQNFAMNEEKVVIAKLLRAFTFELVPGHVVGHRLAAVMRATNGILMYVKKRQHNGFCGVFYCPLPTVFEVVR